MVIFPECPIGARNYPDPKAHVHCDRASFEHVTHARGHFQSPLHGNMSVSHSCLATPHKGYVQDRQGLVLLLLVWVESAEGRDSGFGDGQSLDSASDKCRVRIFQWCRARSLVSGPRNPLLTTAWLEEFDYFGSPIHIVWAKSQPQ